MLADDAMSSSSASCGAPSPTSQLRSICTLKLPVAGRVDGDEPRAIADVKCKRIGPRRIEYRQRRAPDDAPAAGAVAGVDPRLPPGDPDGPGRHTRARG